MQITSEVNALQYVCEECRNVAGIQFPGGIPCPANILIFAGGLFNTR